MRLFLYAIIIFVVGSLLMTTAYLETWSVLKARHPEIYGVQRAKPVKTVLPERIAEPPAAVAGTESTANDPKLTTWIHAFGCRLSDTYIYLVFSNGKVIPLHQSELDAAQLEKLKAIIGDIDGYNQKANCGAQT